MKTKALNRHTKYGPFWAPRAAVLHVKTLDCVFERPEAASNRGETSLKPGSGIKKDYTSRPQRVERFPPENTTGWVYRPAKGRGVRSISIFFVFFCCRNPYVCLDFPIAPFKWR